MTPDERQQSLESARSARHFLGLYIESQIVDARIRADIACLLAEFDRLDEIERNQSETGKKYGHLGAEHGWKGGRPRTRKGKK